MKKIILVLIVAFTLLATLTSCEDYIEKADYEEQATGHEDAGNGDVDDDDEETGSE